MDIKTILAVRRLVKQRSGEQISSSLAYKFMKLLKVTDSDEEFYTERMRDIIDRYSEKDEKGAPVRKDGGISIAGGQTEKCQSEIVELDNTKIDTPSIRFTLGELSEMKFTVTEMFAFDELITGE